jgi:hypothetical protein
LRNGFPSWLGYFILDTSAAHTAGGFLQVSLSKILGATHEAGCGSRRRTPETGRDVESEGCTSCADVKDRWYEPEAMYFRVRTTEGKRYILRYSEADDEWTLQSGFDGRELLSRTLMCSQSMRMSFP